VRASTKTNLDASYLLVMLLRLRNDVVVFHFDVCHFSGDIFVNSIFVLIISMKNWTFTVSCVQFYCYRAEVHSR